MGQLGKGGDIIMESIKGYKWKAELDATGSTFLVDVFKDGKAVKLNDAMAFAITLLGALRVSVMPTDPGIEELNDGMALLMRFWGKFLGYIVRPKLVEHPLASKKWFKLQRNCSQEN